MKPDPYALDNTGLTDESISWHTAYAGYGRDRVEMKVEHVEVQDCRNIERELKTMIAMLTEERDAAVKDAEKCYEWCDALRRYGAENKADAMLAVISEMQTFSLRRALNAKEPSDAPTQEQVLVPREPTHEMVQAGAKLVKDNLPYHTGTRAIYLAMLEEYDRRSRVG